MSEANKHTEQEDCEKVVRCKNCKHSKKIRFTNRNDTLLCTYHQMQKKDMDFCSYGEQKESPLKCELFLPSYLCSTCTKSDCKMNGGNTASNELRLCILRQFRFRKMFFESDGRNQQERFADDVKKSLP